MDKINTNYLCDDCTMKVLLASQPTNAERCIKFCDICSKKIKEKMADGTINIDEEYESSMDAVL